MTYRYYVRGPGDAEYREVSMDEFVRAERLAGFRPRYGRPHWKPVTHTFYGYGWRGKIRSAKEPAS